jgi:hypothetical protein
VEFGDGDTSIEENPVHTYPTSGIFMPALLQIIMAVVLINVWLKVDLTGSRCSECVFANGDGANDILYVKGRM